MPFYRVETTIGQAKNAIIYKAAFLLRLRCSKHPKTTLANSGKITYSYVMPNISSLFVTRLYNAQLAEHGPKIDQDELFDSCYAIAEDDEAGQKWSEEKGYPGYTSYASLTDLPWRFPIFKDMVDSLDKHVAAFAEVDQRSS